MSRPKLLLLDEPSMGIAPIVVKQIFQILRELAKSGMTIFLVEQNAIHALKFSDRSNVIVNGQIWMTGTGPDCVKTSKQTLAMIPQDFIARVAHETLHPR
jgi:branched-chain amino acid transport system ATP-binding protein